MTGLTDTLSFKPLKVRVGHSGSPGPKGEPNSYFNSTLAGNIAAAAYEQPLTIEEIARKVGAASAYVEEIIDQLKISELVRSVKGGKYQTSFIIRTLENRREQSALLKAKAEEMAVEIYDAFAARLRQIREIGFYGCDADDTFLLWAVIPVAIHHQYWRTKDPSYYEANGPIERPDGGKYIATGEILYDEETYKASLPNWEIVRKYVTNGIKTRDEGNLRGLQMESFWSGLIWRDFNGPDLSDLGRIAALIESGAEMTEFDKLSAARLAEKGYITIENGRPFIRIPLFNKDQYAAFIGIIEETLADIGAKPKLESFHEAVVSIWKKLVPSHISKQELNYFATSDGLGIIFAIMEALVRFGKLQESVTEMERKRLTTIVWEQL